MNSTTRDLAANLFQVRRRIEIAAARSGRKAQEITLIAVSKTHSARKIRELYTAGVRHFGENRIQEWEIKKPHLLGIEAIWHMIGHLQKNKAARASRLFDSVDSVDSLALAEKLARARADVSGHNMEARSNGGMLGQSEPTGRLRVLIEVKLDPEPVKSGIDAAAAPQLVEAVMRLPQLELRGLMGVPPYSDDPEDARPYFRCLRELRDATRNRLGKEILPVLSMGMSYDFEIAIEEGATEIRVGTALFGERESA